MSRRVSHPANWRRAPLAEFVEFHAGFAFPGAEQGKAEVAEGGIPFYKVSDMSRPGNEMVLAGAANYVPPRVIRQYGWKSCPPGSIVFAKVGAALLMNRRRILGVPSLIDNNMMAVSPRPSTDGVFLYYLLQAVDFAKFVQDGVVPSVNKSQIGAVPVSVPPLEGQQRIAEILGTVDEAIRLTERLISKLMQAKQGILREILPPDAHSRPELTCDRRGGGGRWAAVPLGSMSEVVGGVALGRQMSGAGTVELPYLRVANVQDGFIDTTDVKMIRVLRSEVARYRLNVGDVLMTEGGDFDKLGRGAVWNGLIDPCLHQNHIFRVRCDRTVLLPEFLAIYSGSPEGRRYFVGSSKQTTNLASMNITQLKSFTIPTPPLQEQGEIVAVIGAVDAEVLEARAEAEKLRQVKQGLMDDLLTGRVRVNVAEEASG